MEMISIVSDLTSFGAAGLMGAMWLVERKMSRRREDELTDAHDRIIRDEQRLERLMKIVEQNSSALARFGEHQRQQTEVIKHLLEEIHHEKVR